MQGGMLEPAPQAWNEQLTTTYMHQPTTTGVVSTDSTHHLQVATRTSNQQWPTHTYDTCIGDKEPA